MGTSREVDKFQVTARLPLDILDRLDDAANKMLISRSTYIQLVLMQHFGMLHPDDGEVFTARGFGEQ